MMRKLKWYYFAPVFLVLLVTAGFLGNNYLIKPAVDKAAAARSAWKTAKDDYESVKAGYPKHLADQVTHAKKFHDDYYTFTYIQNSMPELYDLSGRIQGMGDREKLQFAYDLILSREISKKLKAWERSMGVTSANTYDVPVQELPQPKAVSLSSVQVVKVDFGPQTIRARGYADLVNQLGTKVGRGYCPMVISLASEGGSGDGAAASGGASGTGATSMSGGTPATGGSAAPVRTSALPYGATTTASALPGGTRYAQLRRNQDMDDDGGGGGGGASPPPSTPSRPSTPPPSAPSTPSTPPPAAETPAAPAGATLTLSVTPGVAGYDPRAPKIELKYNAVGYFMTKGWNPMDNAGQTLTEAKQLAANPPAPQKLREPAEYYKPTKILWYFDLPQK